MSYYRTHLFFCTNQKDGGRKCCQNAGASEICDYTRKKIKDLGLHGPDSIRVSSSGCLGRCASGPSLVVYPEGTWYTYQSTKDIDEIIQKHLIDGEIVNHLLMKSPQQLNVE